MVRRPGSTLRVNVLEAPDRPSTEAVTMTAPGLAPRVRVFAACPPPLVVLVVAPRVADPDVTCHVTVRPLRVCPLARRRTTRGWASAVPGGPLWLFPDTICRAGVNAVI